MNRMIESMNKGLKRRYLKEERIKNPTEDEYMNIPSVLTISKACESRGYELVHCYYNNKRNRPVVHVRPAGMNSYLPDVYLNRETNEFEINAWASGQMAINDFEQFLEAQYNGLELAKELTKALPLVLEYGPEFD